MIATFPRLFEEGAVDAGQRRRPGPDVVRRRGDLTAALAGLSPGYVATMGALHDGHLSLIRRSVLENPRTVVSVFVNPSQFGDPSDLAAYPRDLERDAARAGEAGADLVFAPAVDEIYPPGFATAVEIAGPSERWEGAARPGHFRGVATVVALLLNIVRPEHAYFGEKDYQQLLVIRRLHADLAFPGAIVGCPTVRGPDGLPLSSRNARLLPEDRERARVVPRALFRMAECAAAGETDAEGMRVAGEEVLAGEPTVRTEYLAVVDGGTLEPLGTVVPGARAIVAARVGGVRIIDNVAL
ncbi:MAG: Pantoate--beta-alanine ligase [uncultured Thermomicrobiales bacterium]|uniref:Pantothenate synthetase n=1 Tax=uncultured Thermomicrobiales bacterium TaxID=1645740 RepID=A0A6J4U6D9_9BACT|nr:MAG: Pantoate--beta-alanine ligase [uncultured Thermomicrobiales bacterium]